MLLHLYDLIVGSVIAFCEVARWCAASETSAAKLHVAVTHNLQMSEDERKRLTWEDATQRFLDVAELSPSELANPVERGFDRAAWMLHNSLNGTSFVRLSR